jgi:alpha-L-fucosidase
MNKMSNIIHSVMVSSLLVFSASASAQSSFKVKVNTSQEPVAQGKYQPTWQSLSDYQCPEWFRDAKFGIWSHWGPQCQAEYGDWFAREMYHEGSDKYKYSLESRGPQCQFGFKDWIHEWKAEKWNADSLVSFYKESGAKYFFALANHHDNFDLYNSRYQQWNSVAIGPKKDIIAGWSAACRKYGLPFGVSVHASHAWCWYETSRGADTTGAFKGVGYDGWLTKADGKGKWWDGLDPQELYAQNHPLSKNNREWDWKEGEVVTPDQAYCDKFYNRTVDLINKYHPSLLYFDDTVLPLYPFCDAGLDIVAHMYNRSMAEHQGKNESVVFGKILNDEQKKAITWDVERGAPDAIQPRPWQTCTCIGSWHYNKRIFYNASYKTAQQVVQILADVVSKNGNLLLSVPVKGDGTIDTTEHRIVSEIGAWLKVNGESVYGTRPWKLYGEGPSVDSANPIKAQGFNEGRVKYTSSDIRYVQKGKNILYATFMSMPEANSAIVLKSIQKSKSVEMLGYGKLESKSTRQGLRVTMPSRFPNDIAVVLKIKY